MPLDSPSCLFLDFFGTLVEYDANWTELHSYTDTHAMCVALGAELTYEVFIDKWSAAWSLFERERVADNREVAATTVVRYFLSHVLGRAPAESVVEEFDRTWTRDWNRGVRYPEHIVDTVAQLAAGHQLIVVSNTHGPTMVQDHLARMRISPHIKHVVTSIDVGWQKPHPAIYAEALRVGGVRPQEALFVGDNPAADYHGPIAAGIPAILVSANSCPDVPDERRIASIRALPDYLDATTQHADTAST